MMLGEDSVLYDHDDMFGTPNFGELGDSVTIITPPDEYGMAKVLHPVYGIQDILETHLFPMTGNCESR